MARIFHQLTKLGKNVYPYTDIAAVSDSDGRNLKDILRGFKNKIEELRLMIEQGSLVGPQGPKGEAGDNINIRKSETHLQWKLESSEEWIDLIKLDELVPDDIILDENGNTVYGKDIITNVKLNNIINELIDDDLSKNSKDTVLSSRQGKILSNKIDDVIKIINDIKKDSVNCNNSEVITTEYDIDFVVRDNILYWRKDSNSEWVRLFDFNIDIDIPEDLSNFLDKSMISKNLIADPDDYILTVSQGRSLKKSIDEVYEFLENSGLDLNIDVDSLKGENGRTPEFRTEGSCLQWKYTDDETWITLIDIKNNTSDIKIIDSLISIDKKSALSANQGRVLNDKITAILNIIDSLCEGTNSDNQKVEIPRLELKNENKLIYYKLSDEVEWTLLIDLNVDKIDQVALQVIDSLNNTSKTSALSANQGRVLNNKIMSISNVISSIGFNEDGSIAGIPGPKGIDGKTIELINDNNTLKWKYTDENNWNTLITLNQSNGNVPTDVLTKSNIIDNLTTTSTDYVLSARQGKLLKGYIDNLSNYVKTITMEGVSIDIIDNLIEGGMNSALSANQGIVLNDMLSDLGKMIDSLENKINSKLTKTLYKPGYIDIDGDLIIAKNEWTSTIYDQVLPNTLYDIKIGNKYNVFRISYYSIVNGELKYISGDEIYNKETVSIKTPINADYILVGYNTKTPELNFLSYEINSYGS